MPIVLQRLLSSRLPIVVPFVLLAIVGLLSFRDYGIPYDEGIMDSLGQDAYEYVFEGQPWPTDENWRFHGPVVELPLATIQRLFFDIDDISRNYQRLHFRRFACFALFFLGCVALYFLARRHFRNRWWALLACTLLVLTPRIFAHGFYNSRDIPQLSFFTLGILTLLRLLDRPTLQHAAVHGIVCALALTLRMTALLLPAFTLLFLALEWFRRRGSPDPLPVHRTAIGAGVYLVALALATIAFWPLLWEQPLTHFLEAYEYMSSRGGGEMQFLGRSYTGTPWHYVPVWIAVTVPVVYTLFFLAGFVLSTARVVRHRFRLSEERRNDLLFLLWFAMPIFSLIVTGSSIYTEWRHVYFLYPAFILIAVGGLRSLLALSPSRWVSRGLAGLLALQMLSVSAWMLRNHPFENVYFSIPARWVEGNFYLDYWAPSYKQAIEYVLEHNEEQNVLVYSDENVAFLNAFNLVPGGQERIVRTHDINLAQYIVTRTPEIAGSSPLLYAITVDGMQINGIYRGPLFGKRLKFREMPDEHVELQDPPK